jgi:hypothetical protein
MRAHKIAREHTAVLKGLLRIRRNNQQGTPYALQKEENILLASTRRCSLGFAGLAPHSGRSSVPIRRSMFRDGRYSFQLPDRLRGPPNTEAENTSDKQRSIRKTTYGVKSDSTQYGGKLQEKPRFGLNPAHLAQSCLGIVSQIAFGRPPAREPAGLDRGCRGRWPRSPTLR